ncbi:hypothetical protein LCGC14_1064280 [marine sediment metagenome]|uniref:Sigma-70 family RNA polymerase sigma factor n=2 Tax=root TaxID=1 RepID=A0A831VSI9_9FLAO|nr:sigma-70 family RNA polymerase sigma factor [Pricia sp.]HEA22758.1 sigma-70 family RNA polymerase sigma factor [Pricia antarctica]
MKADMMQPNLEAIAVNHDKYMDMANYFTNNDYQRAQDLVQDMYLKIGERLTRLDEKPLEYITLGYCFRCIKYQFFKDEKDDKMDVKDFNDDNEEIEISTKATIYAEDLEGYEFIDDSQDEEIATFKKFLNQVPYINREVLLQHQERTQRQIQAETGVNRMRLRELKNRGLDNLKTILEDTNLSRYYARKKKNEEAKAQSESETQSGVRG